MITEYLKVLKRPQFSLLWTSQVLSQVTINMMNFLLLTRLYTVTGSSIATSLLWVAYCIPALIFGPIGAASTDLLSRRRTLMVTNLLQGLVVFTYIFINQQSIFILYAVVLIYSLLNQFYVPAEAAYLPSTVSEKRLPHANSLFFMTSQGAIVLGFGFAGVVQRLIGFEGALILSTVLLFIAFVSTSFLKEIKPKTAIPGKFEQVLKTFFNSILEGYEFIKMNKQVLYPLLILLGVQSGLSIIIVSLPVIAEQILNISVNYSGVLVVVPAGVGAVLGSIIVPRLLKKGVRKKKIIETALFLIGLAGIMLAIGIPALASNARVVLSTLLIVLIGVSFVGINIPTVTFLQSVTPLWLRGRVFGSLFFMATLVTIFPVLFSGTITEIFGIRTLLTILALTSFSAFVYLARQGDIIIKTEFLVNKEARL
jgi:MFS transporter, DHA3 family, macrolide efflux protein